MNRPKAPKTAEELLALPEWRPVTWEKIPLPDYRFPNAAGSHMSIPKPNPEEALLATYIEEDDILEAMDVLAHRWRPVLTKAGWRKQLIP